MLSVSSGSKYSVFREEDSIVKLVSPQRVYNLPLFEVYLVIDCRPLEAYCEKRIQSAFNYPPCPPGVSDDSHLLKFAMFMEKSYVNERWSPILLYGSRDDSRAAEHLTAFAEILKGFIETKSKALSVGGKEGPKGFLRYIAERTEQIWILEGDFESFNELYPFLCTPVNGSGAVGDVCGGSEMVPLPFHLSLDGDGVYISSRAVRWTAAFLNSFNVAAILADQHTAEKMLQEIIHVGKEIESFVCSIPDHDVVDRWSLDEIHLLFDRSSEFIQGCVERRKRVIIHLHGRSYSAAIGIAWLMRYHSMSFFDAKAFLQSMTPRVCSSLTSIFDERLLCQEELLSWYPHRSTAIQEVDI